MKSRMKSHYALAAGTALILSACSDRTEPAARSKTSGSQREAAASLSPSPGPLYQVPDAFKVALGKVFEGYARVQSALAQDDLAGAKVSFSSMHALLHMMPKDGLDSSAKADWDSTDAGIMASLHPMATAETLDSVRIHFMDFSGILIEAIGKYGIATQAPIYRFHCPMAKGDQGADWLQSDSVPANPYYGKSMLTCGSAVTKIEPS